MWTKSQKISGAVLGLAAVAFGVDRWVLSAPSGEAESAAAASEFAVSRPAAVSQSAAPAAASSAKPTVATTPTTAPVTLASRLTALGVARRFDFEPVGDAFRAADDWFPEEKAAAEEAAKAAVAPASPDAPAKPAKPKVDYAAIFSSAHKLTAVMNNAEGGKIIVNGKFLVPGQQVGGFKLASVGEGSATFVGRGTKVTLRLTTGPIADAR